MWALNIPKMLVYLCTISKFHCRHVIQLCNTCQKKKPRLGDKYQIRIMYLYRMLQMCEFF